MLEALLWGFHNSRSGCCFPCIRGDRRQGGVRPQHGRRGAEGPGVGWRADLAEPDHQDPRPRARSVRPLGEPLAGDPHQSNAYVFRDPQQRPEGVPASKSENQIGTLNQEVINSSLAPASDPDSPLERALQQLGGAIKGRLLMNKSGGMVPAT